MHDDLVFHYTESELQEHLQASENSLRNIGSSKEERWRKKLQRLVPASRVKVNHIRTGEPMMVSRRVLGVFLLMTIADYADQLFGYQDTMFENTNGCTDFTANGKYDTLWPGNGKPRLGMNLMSRMAAVYTLLVREEEIFIKKRMGDGYQDGFDGDDRDEDIELLIPPIFNRCTKILDPSEQIMARDLYWEAVNEEGSKKEKSEDLLVKCIEKNPFVGEPHLLLSQFYLSRGRFEEGEREAEKGLSRLLEWVCSWDKRIPWEGWVSWCRVLWSKAKEGSWPDTTWGVISLGLVK